MICYIVSWRPSWLSDQIAFSNPVSDVVWRVSRLPPWPPSWTLELNDFVILNPQFTPMLPIKFRRNLTYWLWGDVVWRISRWRPSWHWNRTISAILNFHNIPMPPIMFKLNQTYRSWLDVIWRISRWLPWWQSLISERNHFSNSKSPCCPDAFHQLSASSDLRFGSR